MRGSRSRANDACHGREPHGTVRLLTFTVVLSAALAGCGNGTVPVGPASDTNSGANAGPGSTTAASPTAAAGLPVGLDTSVERIVDGDTLVIAGTRRVRLIGVDTPETRDPRRPVQCFGREASAFLERILNPGTAVRLVGDVEQRDVYGRTLAYVYRLPDGLFVNAELLRQGYGQVLTIPPNVAHADRFAMLAREARTAGRGLWSACEAAA